MPTFTVLIPFFQREPGLLRAALESVTAQTLFADRPRRLEPVEFVEPSEESAEGSAITAEILIVDDGSPVPARDEIRGLELPEGVGLRVVEQPNGGVSAARNAGLDATRPSTRMLAIIDSDDVWSPDHLERAHRAHELGADIYTSNWIPVESEKDAFTFFQKLRVEDHRPVPELDDVFEYVGDFAEQEVKGSIGRPSALVFSWPKFGDLRNDRTLLHGSEDQLWRLNMIARGPRVLFSARPEVFSGEGVSVYSGANWATVKGLLIDRDRLACLHRAQRNGLLSPPALLAKRRVVSRTRTDLVGVALHLLVKGPRPGLGVLASVAKRDPGLVLAWPLHLARILRRKFGRSDDSQ